MTQAIRHCYNKILKLLVIYAILKIFYNDIKILIINLIGMYDDHDANQNDGDKYNP